MPGAGGAPDRLVLDGDRLVMRSESLKEGAHPQGARDLRGPDLARGEAADNLNIRAVTLNSNDPSVPSLLDLDRMVKLLIGSHP